MANYQYTEHAPARKALAVEAVAPAAATATAYTQDNTAPVAHAIGAVTPAGDEPELVNAQEENPADPDPEVAPEEE